MRVVAKIGTSSITDADGVIDRGAIAKLCAEVAGLWADGHQVLVVSSGAVAAGMAALGFTTRPRDPLTLQAFSAVGQSRLLQVYNDLLGEHGLVAGQLLISPLDFFDRTQYLHARATLNRLFELGVVPVINENDALTDSELRFGDNDRIAALIAHLVGADLLVLLTDTDGVFTADPRRDEAASLIEEILAVDRAMEAVVGGAGTARGSGGMASKLAAAKIASWSGVRTVIAAARRDRVLADAVPGAPGVGTVVQPRPKRLTARKLWIAFAVPAVGAGHRRRRRRTDPSRPGGVAVTGRGHRHKRRFRRRRRRRGAGPHRRRVRQGPGAHGRQRRPGQLGQHGPDELIHRDELVLVP